MGTDVTAAPAYKQPSIKNGRLNENVIALLPVRLSVIT
jgi:hypothetical protein